MYRGASPRLRSSSPTPAATSSKCSTSASSAPPRCARRKSSSSSRRATASTRERSCVRWKKKGSGSRFLEPLPARELFVGDAAPGFLGLIEAAAESRFVALHHAVGVAIRVGTHAWLLARGEMLARAARVARVVHLAVADRRAGLDLADRAAFGVLVGAAIKLHGVVADEARARHVRAAVGRDARTQRFHIVPLQRPLAPPG